MVIAKHVADLLLLVVDKDKSGTISFAEFHAFDWSKFIDGVNSALQKRAELKVAEFEAKIPTLQTFNTPREHVDGDYFLYLTKSFGQDEGATPLLEQRHRGEGGREYRRSSPQAASS